MAVYFLTPDYDFPSGGVRVIYRHVDILNANGIEAHVLHKEYGFRCEWFSNSTSIAYWDNSIPRRAYFKARRYLQPERPREIFLRNSRSQVIGAGDILVLPEIYGPELAEIGAGIPKVILNQNCYLTFRGYPLDGTDVKPPYSHPDVKAVMINSEDGFDYLKYVFNDVRLTRFHLSIDPELFSYQERKERQIVYSPRKSENAVRQVVSILKSRNALNGFKLVPFSGIPQSEVAGLLQDSAIFLSFGDQEGFGLPPAEAMACGCIVIGYHAGGGREFMTKALSFPIDPADIVGYAKAVEQVTTSYDIDNAKYVEMGRKASEYIRETYSPEREEEDVVTFWKTMI